MSVEITVKIAVWDEHADDEDSTGLAPWAYVILMDAVSRFGEVVDISKD